MAASSANLPSPADKNHWEQIYAHKTPDQLSWTEAVPTTSLDFIHSFGLPKTAGILDVGGGDGRLVDFLLEEGFEDITVLDISANALNRAKKRLGSGAAKVNWVVSDITTFKPGRRYALWHDRATFHFLTSGATVANYLQVARAAVTGYMTIGTFSTEGPEACSGLRIKQYDEMMLTRELKQGFSKIRCIRETHVTPFDTKQQFLFCSFRRQN